MRCNNLSIGRGYLLKRVLRLSIGLFILFSLSSTVEAANQKTVALVMKALSNPFFFKMVTFYKYYRTMEIHVKIKIISCYQDQ